jgi:hypothetical protein
MSRSRPKPPSKNEAQIRRELAAQQHYTCKSVEDAWSQAIIYIRDRTITKQPHKVVRLVHGGRHVGFTCMVTGKIWRTSLMLQTYSEDNE